MKIYTPEVLEDVEWAMPEDDGDFEVLRSLGGRCDKDTWSPICMYLDREEGQLRKSDFPWLGEHVLVMRQRSVGALHGFLEQYGEVLPLECDETPLYLFNTSTVIDALDLGRSEVARIPGGKIIDIRSHVFHPDVVAGMHIFKIPQLLHSFMYLSQEFVDRVTDADLQGVGFRLVWEDPHK